MAYFLPSYFQKRILRYALSRLDFLDAEQLNLDNLDIAWGKRSVVELRDVGVQLKKLASLCNIPPPFMLVRASIRVLRITVPADLYNSGIVAEITGVDIHLNAVGGGQGDNQPSLKSHKSAQKRNRKVADQLRRIRPKIYDPGGSSPGNSLSIASDDKTSDSVVLPTTDELAKSFLQTEPKEEKAQLQAAVAQSQHLDESEVHDASDGITTVGIGDGLSLPAFLSGFLKGIGDRFRLSLSEIRVDISLQVDLTSESSVTSTASERSEKVTLRFSVKDVQYESVFHPDTATSSQPIRSNNISPANLTSNPEASMNRRQITLSDVQGAVLSDSSMFSSLSRYFAPSSSSSSESTVARSPSTAKRKIRDPVHAPADQLSDAEDLAALHQSMIYNSSIHSSHSSPLDASRTLGSGKDSDLEHNQRTTTRKTGFDRASQDERSLYGGNNLQDSLQSDRSSGESVYNSVHDLSRRPRRNSSGSLEGPSSSTKPAFNYSGHGFSTSEQEVQNMEKPLGSSYSTNSPSPDARSTASRAHEDLSESRIYSHEEAESMYMSAMTDIPLLEERVDPRMPGAWDSRLEQETENISTRKSTSKSKAHPTSEHLLPGIGSVSQHDSRDTTPADSPEISTQEPHSGDMGTFRQGGNNPEPSQKPPDSGLPSTPESLQATFEGSLIVSKTFVLIDRVSVTFPCIDIDTKPSRESHSKSTQDNVGFSSSRLNAGVHTVEPAASGGPQVPSGEAGRHGADHSTASLSPKTPDPASEHIIAVESGTVELRSDMSLARLTALAMRQLKKDLNTTAKRKESNKVKVSNSKYRLIINNIAWKFYDRVVSIPATDNFQPSPRLDMKDPFLDSELLLRANIQGFDCVSETSARSYSSKVTLTKLVFGYANGDILAFDSSVKMRESTRDILAPIDKDIILTVSEDPRTSKINLSTLPVSVRLDLRRLDETFAWLGGVSSILDLGNSVISSVTKSDPKISDSKKSRKHKRGVHFESPHPGRPPDKDISLGQKLRKVTARIGGLVCVLEGSESSLRLEGTALKIISRAEGLAMQLDRLHLSGLNLKNTPGQPAIVLQVSNVRIEYVSEPSEVDLARLVALSSPSKDSYEEDDDILLPTLLRQRRQGGVVRLTAERSENSISSVDDLRQLSTLLEELKKLGTVTKYLPEDDRPGILLLALIRQCRCEAHAGQPLGSISSELKNIEIAHVTFPSVFALGISNAIICRNQDEELLGPVFTHNRTEDVPSPMFMARFIGNEMEPTIKLKLHQVRIEYHVPFILAIMNMNGNAQPEELLSDMAGSIATLTERHHGMRKVPGSPRENLKSSTKSLPTANATKIDVTIRDSLIGLNPRKSPAKGLLVLTKTHFVGNIPKDKHTNAVLEVQRAALMIINDTENIKVQDKNLEDEPSLTTINQVNELESMGFVSVSSISAARVALQVTQDQKSCNKSIEVEVKDDLFVLETCADSTQTLQLILNGLSPPLPPSKETVYRTEVVPIEDMLSSFSGIAFASDGERAQSDRDNHSLPVDDEDADNTERSQDLSEVDSLYESEPSRQFGGTTDSMLDDDPESVLVDRSILDIREALGDSSLQAESQEEVKGPPLEFQDNHFGATTSVGGTAHRWNTQQNTYGLGNQSTIRSSPIRVRVRDVHVIWNLFDGYDWQHTRDTIGKAISDVETRALERFSKRDKRKAPDVEDDEESVIGDFLFNSIYIGIPANRDPRSLSRQVQHNLNDLGSETDSSAPSTMTSSPSRQSFPPTARNKKLRLARSKHHKMTFELKGISADLIVFPPGSGETQSSIDIRVQDLDVFDHVPTSTWKKFATYMYDAGERESETSMVHLEILNVRPVPELAASEIVLKATILPLRLHVDQDALDFLTRFFEFKDDNASESTAKPDAAFLQRVEINSVRLKLDFKPKRVDYAGIRSGYTNEFMNFFILDRADMVLRHVIIYGISGFDRLGKTLNDIWMPDIKRNQLPGVLAGLAPVRSLVNVGGGVRDLVVVPIREYQKDGRIVRSLQKGALAFAKTTTGELVKLGVKLAIGTQTVLQGAENLLTQAEQQRLEAAGGWEDAELDEDEKKQISLYADQPVGVVQGLRGAYASVERDLVTAKDAIVAMPGEVMESGTAGGAAKAVLKGVPTIILRPALGVSKAVGQTLMGATNSLDPANRRRIEEVSFSSRLSRLENGLTRTEIQKALIAYTKRDNDDCGYGDAIGIHCGLSFPPDGISDSEHSHLDRKYHHQNPFLKLLNDLDMSSTSPSREGSAIDKKHVLSDEQRKANHTSSETKRRNRIKAFYWDLCQLVPDLKEKAPENCKRERVVLDQAREFARSTMLKRNELIDALEAEGIDVEKEYGLTVSMIHSILYPILHETLAHRIWNRQRFEILPPVDPKAMKGGDDGSAGNEERDESPTENEENQGPNGEVNQPARKRRRRN
ncbi:MAG: hypothetical protein Q9213_004843 [Squamulea squamosa]